MEKHLNLSSYILEEQRKAALDTVLDLEFVDEDLFADKDYVETVAEDYDFLISGGSTAYQLPADSSGNHNVASSNLRPGGTYTYREMLREKADL